VELAFLSGRVAAVHWVAGLVMMDALDGGLVTEASRAERTAFEGSLVHSASAGESRSYISRFPIFSRRLLLQPRCRRIPQECAA